MSAYVFPGGVPGASDSPFEACPKRPGRKKGHTYINRMVGRKIVRLCAWCNAKEPLAPPCPSRNIIKGPCEMRYHELTGHSDCKWCGQCDCHAGEHPGEKPMLKLQAAGLPPVAPGAEDKDYTGIPYDTIVKDIIADLREMRKQNKELEEQVKQLKEMQAKNEASFDNLRRGLVKIQERYNPITTSYEEIYTRTISRQMLNDTARYDRFWQTGFIGTDDL